MKHNLNAITALAYRDLMKFLRDKPRLISTFIFPVIFIITLGGSLQANLGESTGYNFLAFTFTGVFAQTMFQSATMGIVSILDDRENDFSCTSSKTFGQKRNKNKRGPFQHSITKTTEIEG